MEDLVKSQLQTTLFQLGFIKTKNPSIEELMEGLLEFQQTRGLSVTGELDPQTLRVLEESHWSLGDRVLKFQPSSMLRGDDVAALQSRLIDMGFDIGRVDGIYGKRTESGVIEFQKSAGVKPDGVCGPTTVIALMRLVKTVSGGLPTQLRDEIRRAHIGPSLTNKCVVIDPQFIGHGELIFDIATRLEGRLIALGVSTILTRTLNSEPEEKERIEIANSVGADLVISLSLDNYPSEKASGYATYYYGNDSHGAHSVVGEKFANLVQGEIAARTDLVNCRTHAKTWNLLRLTKSPTIQINLGYLANQKDIEKLKNINFREALVESLVISIQRLYLTSEEDAKTGTLRISDLRKLGIRK